MPFSRHRGAVAGIFQQRRDRDDIVIKGAAIKWRVGLLGCQRFTYVSDTGAMAVHTG